MSSLDLSISGECHLDGALPMRNAKILVVVTLLLSACSDGAQSEAANDAPKSVAVTIDDVPGVAMPGYISANRDAIVAMNRRLIGHLEAFDAPATAFVVPGRGCAERDCELLERVLDVWLKAGHDLANHSLTHRSLNTVSAEYQIEDIENATKIIQSVLEPYGKRLKYFRHPALHSGDTESKRDSVEAYLANSHLEDGPVTIDNDEWIFAGAYSRAMAARDTAAMARIGSEYLDYMDRVFAFYEDLSQDLVGRQIRQILLIHDNALNAEHLDDLLALIRHRDYRFVTLEEALQDSVYLRGNPYVGPRGLSWLQRWRVAEGLETLAEPGFSDWIREQAGM